MVEETFRFTAVQRRSTWRVLGLVGVCLVLVGVQVGRGAWVALPVGVVGLLALGVRRARTVIDERGIVTRNLWRTRRYAWTEVCGVERETEGTPRGEARWIRVRARDGSHVRLSLPYDSQSRGAGSDPDFAAKYDRIRAAWQRNAG